VISGFDERGTSSPGMDSFADDSVGLSLCRCPAGLMKLQLLGF